MRRWIETLAKRVDSWVVSDEFWRRVEPLIPARPVANKTYVRRPGAGRPPKPPRLVLEAIVFVLRTCWRRFKIEPPCRLNFEPGLMANL